MEPVRLTPAAEARLQSIRRLQAYVKSQALSHAVPIIPNYGFDQSIAAVIDLVMERATARAGEIGIRDDVAKGTEGRIT